MSAQFFIFLMLLIFSASSFATEPFCDFGENKYIDYEFKQASDGGYALKLKPPKHELGKLIEIRAVYGNGYDGLAFDLAFTQESKFYLTTMILPKKHKLLIIEALYRIRGCNSILSAEFDKGKRTN